MNLRVVVSSPSLELSGANVLVANLLDQLQSAGIAADWVVTGHQPGDDPGCLGPRSFKIHRLPPSRMTAVRQRQKSLAAFLEERSPCAYLPNFDFDMACVAPALSPANQVVLIVHSDDPVYHNFVAQFGNLFNGVVCVSKFLEGALRTRHPRLQKRIVHIPFGVQPPSEMPKRVRLLGQRLEVAYCGRISFHQKRVQDLAAIINRCHGEQLPLRFHIAGTGPDERAFFAQIDKAVADGVVTRHGLLPNTEVMSLLASSDVLLMTSDFEGLPVVLLEAMSRGCVPVVTRTASGVSEVIAHELDGYMLPVGDIDSFVRLLKQLCANPARLQVMQGAAYRKITAGGFTLARAARDYTRFLDRVATNQMEYGVARSGKAILPHHYTLRSRIGAKGRELLTKSWRWIGRWAAAAPGSD